MAVSTMVINKPYRVVHKPHRVIQPNGTVVRFEVGDIVDGLRLSDLEAFKDRFVPATQDEVTAYYARQDALITTLGDAPLLADARQAADEEAALEAELLALQQRLQAARHRTELAEQVQYETERSRLRPGRQSMSGRMEGIHEEMGLLAEQPEAQRVVLAEADAQREAAQKADAQREAAQKADAERQVAELAAKGKK